MNEKLKNKINKIKVVAFDVDGVLTNGTINVDEKGNEIKVFNVQDGLGIALLRRAGLKIAIITARSSGAVRVRAKDLKVDKLYMDAFPKSGAFEDLKKFLNVKSREICFVGDDLPDLVVLKEVGLAIAVKNASAEVKKCADYITKNKGGEGAVREGVEMILKTQKKWTKVLEHFS